MTTVKLVKTARDNDGGYVVPVKALTEADAMLGCGIHDDNSFKDLLQQAILRIRLWDQEYWQ